MPDVVVVHVGDFEFAAAGRLQGLDDSEHVRRVDVDSDHREVTLRVGLRLLLNADDFVALQFRDAVAFRILHLLEPDPGPVRPAVRLL